MGTACPFDLTSADTLEPTALLTKPREEVLLDTANGTINADLVAHMRVSKIDETIEPFVLDQTPDVLNIWRRCMLHGYAFHWNPFDSRPFLVSPD